MRIVLLTFISQCATSTEKKLYSQLSDIDRKALKLLLDSGGSISTQELSDQLGMPVSTMQRRRKRLESEYIVKTYTVDPTKFDYRRVNLLIYTLGGQTMLVGKELFKRNEVTSVVRTIGEHTIDLEVEVFIKDNSELLNLLENIKAMKGVRDVIWTEAIEIIGRKSPPNHNNFINA